MLIASFERDRTWNSFWIKNTYPFFTRLQIPRRFRSFDRSRFRDINERSLLSFGNVSDSWLPLGSVRLQMEDPGSLKRTILIFSLVHADIKSMISYLEDEFVRNEHPDSFFTELIEVIIYSLSMELKKVFILSLSVRHRMKQYDHIYSKIQNSQGILVSSIQHIMVSIAQYFDPRVEGHELFPDYVTRLDQSVRLRRDLLGLFEYIRKFTQGGTVPGLTALFERSKLFEKEA